MTFIVMAAGPPDGWTRDHRPSAPGPHPLAALLASRVSRRLFRLAALVTLRLVDRRLGSVVIERAATTERRVLPAQRAPRRRRCRVVIARALWRRGVIDIRTVMGAVCIYVLLGMMFAFVYAAIDAMSSGPFFVQTAHATTPDFLYFSFITQTTVGYGDFTARGPRPRAGGARGAGRPALPGDGDRGAREPAERPRSDRGRRPVESSDVPAPTRPHRRAARRASIRLTQLVVGEAGFDRPAHPAGRAGRGSRAGRATAGSTTAAMTNTTTHRPERGVGRGGVRRP